MSVMTDLEQEFRNLADTAKTDATKVLADVHEETLKLEAKLKTEIVLLRQRAANLSSDAEVEAEKLVIEAKLFLNKVLAFVKELEHKLASQSYSYVKDYSTGEAY